MPGACSRCVSLPCNNQCTGSGLSSIPQKRTSAQANPEIHNTGRYTSNTTIKIGIEFLLKHPGTFKNLFRYLCSQQKRACKLAVR